MHQFFHVSFWLAFFAVVSGAETSAAVASGNAVSAERESSAQTQTVEVKSGQLKLLENPAGADDSDLYLIQLTDAEGGIQGRRLLDRWSGYVAQCCPSGTQGSRHIPSGSAVRNLYMRPRQFIVHIRPGREKLCDGMCGATGFGFQQPGRHIRGLYRGGAEGQRFLQRPRFGDNQKCGNSS